MVYTDVFRAKAAYVIFWKPTQWKLPDSGRRAAFASRPLSHQYQETGFSTVKIEVLSKLLAFIDGAGLVDTTYAESDKWVLLSPEFRAIWQDRKRCEYWFCSKLLRLLRPSIRYWRCYEKRELLVGWLFTRSVNQRQHDENAGRRLWRFLYPFSSFVQQSVGRKSEEWITKLAYGAIAAE